MIESQKALAESVVAVLGPSDQWILPGGYPQSLALCVIDSIQSIGQRYGGVRRVVGRYCDYRHLAQDEVQDGAPELAQSFVDLGGVEGWMREIGTQNRTYASHAAPRKAAVIEQAAELLLRNGIPTTQALRATNGASRESLKSQWLNELPSQGSGLTWRYLLMLAGDDGVKPDRMILRFLAALRPELGKLTVDEAASLVTDLAAQLNVRANVFDHRIWLHQRVSPDRSL